MDFLSKAFPTFGKAFSWAKKEVVGQWTTIWGDQSQDRVTQNNLMENDKNWVYVCVDKIADHVSAVKLKLMRYNANGDDEEVFDHPLLDLLDRPNEQMTGRDFRYISVSHLELTGNAYWLKDNNGQPTALFPLNPRNVTPKLAKDGMSIESYKYRSNVYASAGSAGLGDTVYDPDRIIHPKYPNPKNPLLGRGTVEPIAEWVDVDNYATEFNRRFFLNSANFGGALETEATTQAAQEQIRMSLENNYKGLQNAHKLLILPKGVKLNDQSKSPKDMQMKEADAIFRDKILAAFGVPKSVVGIVEDVNRANAESSNYVFAAFTIKPKIERLITYLNEFFLPLFKGTEQMYLTYDDPTPENATLEIQENQASLGNAPYATVNEVRADKGLPPVEGGDIVYAPAGFQPLGTVSILGEQDSEIVNEPAKEFKKRKITKRSPRGIDKRFKLADTITEKVATFYKSHLHKEEMATVHKNFITRVTTYELQLNKLVKDHDQNQKQAVIAKVRALDPKARLSPTDLFDKEAEIEKMIKFTEPLVLKLTKEEGERALTLVAKGQVVGFLKKDYAVSDRLKKIIAASVKRMSRGYTQTTLNTLTEKINDSIQDGDSLDDITKTVSDVYGLTDEYRAERVARTEVFSAANDASKDAYIESGVVSSVRWKTAEDELTCEFCGPMDNTIIPVADKFFDKGDTVDGADGGEYDLSYEGVENPPLHPNCRCYILPEEISIKATPEAEHKTVDTEDEIVKTLVDKKDQDDVWEALANLVNEDEQTTS